MTDRAKPLSGVEKQEQQAKAELLKRLNRQIEDMRELRHYQRQLGKVESKNFSVVIKYLRALKAEVEDGRYNRAAILAVLKEPIIGADGSTPR